VRGLRKNPEFEATVWSGFRPATTFDCAAALDHQSTATIVRHFEDKRCPASTVPVYGYRCNSLIANLADDLGHNQLPVFVQHHNGLPPMVFEIKYR